jgi:predicted permease
LPILLTAGVGFVFGRINRPDIKSVSRLAFHVFSPCLIFTSLTNIEISGSEFGSLALFTLTVSAIMGVLSFLCGRLFRADRQMIASLVVASMFVNSGNYGLAANKFAFGEAALGRAVVCFVFGTIILYSAGVLISSMGRLSAWHALRNLLSVPALYSLLAAFAVRQYNWQLPVFLVRTVTLLGDVAIPLMLVILGMQVAKQPILSRTRIMPIGVAVLLQLVAAPLIGLVLAPWIGLSGIARQAAILQAAMPAAIAATVLTVEYDLDAPLVNGTVMLTTILSPLTLTPLIAYLVLSA